MERYRELFPASEEQSGTLPTRSAALDPFVGANELDTAGQTFLSKLCKSFTNLVELHITNGLDDEDLKDETILEILQSLPTLQVLVLLCHDFENLFGFPPVRNLTLSIGHGLSLLPKLTCLCLEGVYLDPHLGETLPALSLPCLKQLAIYKCDFDDSTLSWLYNASKTRSVLRQATFTFVADSCTQPEPLGTIIERSDGCRTRKASLRYQRIAPRLAVV